MANNEYDWQGFILIGAGLGIVAVLVVPRLARLEGSGNLVKVLIAALLAKFAFAMIAYLFAFGVYGGTADASAYDRIGETIAYHIRALDFASVTPYLTWGTSFLDLFTGIIYAITGPSIYGGYLIYAFLAFLGSYFFYRAFQVAFPHGDRRLFLLLIFFFPSLLYWANGISKDALISLFIGLYAYGAARIARNQIRGLIPLTFGLAATALVRPHVATAFTLALGLAILVRGVGKRSIGPVTYVIGLLVIGAIMWFTIPRLASELGITDLSPGGVVSRFMQQQDNTFIGGSAYQIADITDPIRAPFSILSLVFRPFPWETHNLQSLVQALEGMSLMILVIWRIKNVGRALGASMSDVYLRYIFISILGLLMTFTAIANYGILVRERAMMLPFVLMLIAYDRRPPIPNATNNLPIPRPTIARPRPSPS